MKIKHYNKTIKELPILQEKLFDLIDDFEKSHQCTVYYHDEEYDPDLQEIVEYLDVKD